MNAHRKAQKSGEVVASPAGPGGVLTSFVNGVEELSNALAASFNSTEIIKSSAVRAIEQNEDKTWQIITAENSYTADCVVCATPAYASAKLVANLDQQLSQQLAQIHYAPLAVVCLGYAAADVNFDVNGFGYLLARGEEVPILGTLWDSSIFAARAPDGKILFRSMLGGAARPELLKLDDAELVQLVRDSLAKILGVSTPPEMVQVFRHLQAIPEYRVGHPELVAEIMSQAKTHPGLFISGNAYYGVGINDCVAQAYKVSQSLCEYVAQNQ
jgi:oxygen-dependent protoporphyrinogen oxidase